MTYQEAKLQSEIYLNIVGKPVLNKMKFLDGRKITSLLVSPKAKIKQVFSDWWSNGNDNKKAVLKMEQLDNFEVFVMSYEPSLDHSIYYLRLSKYIELEN